MSSVDNTSILTIFDKDSITHAAINYDQLEKATVVRMRLLQKVQKATAIWRKNNTDDDSKQDLLLLTTDEVQLLREASTNDASHLTCRFALSNYRTMNWFIDAEVNLFEYIYLRAPRNDQQNVETKLDIRLPIIDHQNLIKLDLNGRWPIADYTFDDGDKKASEAQLDMQNKNLPLRAVPMNELPPSFIAKRLIYLRNGYGFVPQLLFARIVCERFRRILTEKMSQTRPQTQEFNREVSKIGPITAGIRALSASFDMKGSRAKISDSTKPATTRQQFIKAAIPNCMQNLMQKIARHEQLINDERLIIVKFMKDVGHKVAETKSFVNQIAEQHHDMEYARELQRQVTYVYDSGNWTGPMSCAYVAGRSTDEGRSMCPFVCGRSINDNAKSACAYRQCKSAYAHANTVTDIEDLSPALKTPRDFYTLSLKSGRK